MKKRTTVRVITFLSAAAVVAGTMAFQGARRARSLELYARANTQHAFDELVTSVTELSTALEKSVYITDPALESALCTQIFGRAATAQMAMGALPWSSQELERMAGFLSRVGDYACTLSRTVGGTGGYSREELENLTELSETASVLSTNLQDMQARVMAGDLTMEEVYGAAETIGSAEGQAPLAGTVFRSMEAEFPELPALIYDGPFSESLTSARPVYLAGLAPADEAEARAAAARFLGLGAEDVTFQGDCAGQIPCRRYQGRAGGGDYTVYVTNQGAQVLSALCSRMPGRATLGVDEARARARSFLEQQGFRDLRESYHMVEGNVLTVNYEYDQDGVLCYPDLIKVGVALDTGAVTSYDARGYLSAHRERDLPEPVITRQQARQTVPETLSVRDQQLALIPSLGGEERLCHELVCQARDGRRYLLYVNAVTGAQEKILILLEDESGALTI